MALQGDLESFALPDVLRLLAGTAKSGRLVIEGPTASGEIDLRDGQVLGGTTSAASRATEAADVVYELLRLESGSFDFDDTVDPADGDGSSVADVLAAAQQLVAEWDDVSKVVPSVDAWVHLRPELDSEDVSITADQWRMVAALGAGSSVRSLAERFDITDLSATQQVRDLIGSGLVELGGSAPETVAEVEAPVVPESEPEAPVTELGLLAAEDGPVVLETRDDALLPEPLPGEGTSFAGDLDGLTSVDGRAFDPIDPASHDDTDPNAPEVPTPPAAEALPDDVVIGEQSEDDIWSSTSSVDPDADPISDETWAKAGWDDNPPVDHLSEAEAGKASKSKGDKGDDPDPEGDRGSLMKFLSSVKN